MIFIQRISIVYHKDVRYPDYAAQRAALRFCKEDLPERSAKDPDSDCEVYFSSHLYEQSKERMAHYSEGVKMLTKDKLYNGKGYYPDLGGRVTVSKAGECYGIGYLCHKGQQWYVKKFSLSPGDYGRIVYNERRTYEDDGKWYYVLTVFNFLVTGPDKAREKMFFVKEPENYFEDMKYLRYS
ncbi:MAG: hypothetical protein IJ806_07925 [Ruminococcus sp.]|nr:hypothetical protein [Ruminococcus sp.]